MTIRVPFERDPNNVPYAERGRLSPFDEKIVSKKTPLIELIPTYGISTIRNVQTTNASGAIALENGEIKMSTTANGADSATLDSAERGRYIPGFGAEVGVAMRSPSSLSGDMEQKWGYFDDNNGFGFGRDATGIYTFIRKGGTTTKTRQSDWNVDKLDGTGPSGLTLDVSKGYIYQIPYSWYGYGTIVYQVIMKDDEKEQHTITVHRHSDTGQLTTEDPNLPIRAEIDNGGTATAQELYIGGRQYAIQGNYRPNRRVVGQYRLGLSSVGTTFLPTVSFRRKSSHLGVSVKIEGVDIITDGDLVYQLRANGSLTSASYGTPSDATASETACEADNSATAISGGELLYEGLVASSGTGSNQAGFVGTGVLGFDLPEQEPVTLAVRRVSGTGATVTAVLRWREEW